jgi:hypothetical protein
MKKLTFLIGAAAGYVLGTRAGRERYKQIADGARSLSSRPVVQQAQTKIKDLAGKGSNVVTAKLATAEPEGSATDEPEVTRTAPKEAAPTASGQA